MSKGKRALKIIRNIIIALLCLIIAFSVVMLAVHKALSKKEFELLKENGYYNPVSVGDYNLNVFEYGSDNPKHTFVGMAGLGMHNYSLTIQPMLERFKDENRIVVVERAGYGMSDDCNLPQTVENIVNDYRTALKNAGIPAPYILLPHSIGGIYATYWVSKYPEEIEGIVFLDGSGTIGEEETFENRDVDFTDTIEYYACKFGFQRLVIEMYDPHVFSQSTEETKAIDKALTWQNASSKALISETGLMNKNCLDVYNQIVSTDVPKVYICANGACTTKEELVEYFNYIIEEEAKIGKTLSLPDFNNDKNVEKQLALCKEYRDTYIYPYAKSLGNCKVELLPSDHLVYYSHPTQCADIIETLVKEIEGKN